MYVNIHLHKLHIILDNEHIYIYIYIYVCIYVCMYVCMYVLFIYIVNISILM